MVERKDAKAQRRNIAGLSHRTMAVEPQGRKVRKGHRLIAPSLHRNLTAKIAKNIAKAIAGLSHRAIAPSHGETADNADGRRFHRTIAIYRRGAEASHSIAMGHGLTRIRADCTD